MVDGGNMSPIRKRGRVRALQIFRRISGELRLVFRNGIPCRDQRDGQAAFHFRVHRRAHDDLGALAAASDLFHHAVDLGHGQIFSAHEAHENGVGFGEGAAFIQQRMGEEFFHGFARAGGAAASTNANALSEWRSRTSAQRSSK